MKSWKLKLQWHKNIQQQGQRVMYKESKKNKTKKIKQNGKRQTKKFKESTEKFSFD